MADSSASHSRAGISVGLLDRAQAVALNNDLDQFMTVFDDILEGIMIDRHSANDALLGAFLDKPDFRQTLAKMIGHEVYRTIRASGESA